MLGGGCLSLIPGFRVLSFLVANQEAGSGGPCRAPREGTYSGPGINDNTINIHRDVHGRISILILRFLDTLHPPSYDASPLESLFVGRHCSCGCLWPV